LLPANGRGRHSADARPGPDEGNRPRGAVRIHRGTRHAISWHHLRSGDDGTDWGTTRRGLRTGRRHGGYVLRVRLREAVGQDGAHAPAPEALPDDLDGFEYRPAAGAAGGDRTQDDGR